MFRVAGYVPVPLDLHLENRETSPLKAVDD
jgi:hypothetical protein